LGESSEEELSACHQSCYQKDNSLLSCVCICCDSIEMTFAFSATAEDVDKAVKAAKKAFETWSKTDGKTRAP
jgi:delta 1-pyrroline-5-carboxylate dehydrogenase